ncbi:MAG: hypothetical protein R3C68_16435 [Myxococcota bacterium]
MEQTLGQLKSRGLLPMTTVLGGFNNAGLDRALYSAAEKFAAVKRDGVMDGTGCLQPVVQLDHGTIFGQEKGDAQPLFNDLAHSAMLIAVHPDAKEVKAIEDRVREGGVVIVLGGAEKNELLDIPGVLQLVTDADPR